MPYFFSMALAVIKYQAPAAVSHIERHMQCRGGIQPAG
jgi:hypothetical protein